ncbi:MAG: alanine--tRNA ligase [Anaerolineae bacterium]|nr:alanine--tRNA ligase [Anaerolineae bacterium]
MRSAEIRSTFLQYFAERGHTIVPSSSLVPHGDPTLLFTNAGMVQFKDVFLGLEKRDYVRATTAQKCMRVSGKHNDLEEVGPSPRHHTFFEMLGNFSFGDYFKREAIGYAWELLTEVLGLPRERLWATIYREDDEAAQLWQEVVGLPPERIVRLGKKDNFWMMGDVGPCGPCSEILYDRGEAYCTCGRPDCSPAHECDRWMELWNLVFMQFETTATGEMHPLPRPSIDTGMGLERITAVIQGVESNYETDLFVPIIQRTQQLLGHSDAEVQERLVSYRVIADHARAIAFLIGDGVLPGNEGRNYVLRLILRRAARHGKLLGFEGPFLYEVVPTVIEIMGEHYDELVRRREFILRVVQQEEERFQRTLSVGLSLLDDVIADVLAKGDQVIPGDVAFRLYDTYGFPLDLTRDVAREHGLGVDEEGYHKALEEQRARARAAQAAFRAESPEELEPYAEMLRRLQEEGLLGAEGVEHLCYEATELDTQVLGIFVAGQPRDEVSAGEEAELVLAATPFYVESGGQVTDTGHIFGPETQDGSPAWRFAVREAARPVLGLIVHRGRMAEGHARVGDPARALVDRERRMDIARNHTATHLLHKALRETLGEHVQQAGSLVAPDRLRFDFSHTSMLTREELAEVERKVNEAILADYPVQALVMGYREAVAAGAIALFDEKYGDRVRVIRVGPEGQPFSQELCGGTHVQRTGHLGFFHIVSEASIGAGLRRIEAVTGHAALRLLMARLAILDDLAALLKAPPEEVGEKVRALLEENEALHKEVAAARKALALRDLEACLAQVQQVQAVNVVAQEVQAQDRESLREMTDWFRQRLGSAAVVLGAVIDGRPALVAAVTPDLVEKGLHAGNLVKEVAKVVGGGGGGRPTLAEAGGRDPERLAEALSRVPQLVEEALGA